MREYRREGAPASKNSYLRRRIACNRARAKFVGILYLFASVALAVVVCTPLFTGELASLQITKFWKVFKPSVLKQVSLANVELLYEVIATGLYLLMLMGVFNNAVRSFKKLGWLFKKSANSNQGFNRNVYAMEDLGKIFSGSYVVVLLTYFFIAILCKDWKGGVAFDAVKFFTLFSGSTLVHLFNGVVGANTRYYDVNEGEIVEETRAVGRFAPFLRNLLQLASAVALAYFYLRFSTLHTMLPELFKEGGAKSFLGKPSRFINLLAQTGILLCLCVLFKHATATTEYNFDGVHGAGMRNFRIFSFCIFLLAGGKIIYDFFMFNRWKADENLLIILCVALAMGVIEWIMREMPKPPMDKKSKEYEEEFTLDEISFARERRLDQSF